MSQLFRLKNGTVLLSTEAPGGIYNSSQLKKIAELCSKELAIVKATEDQRLALFVKESEVDHVAQQLRAIGLGFRHYQDSLHQPVSCLGELCEEHEQPAMATAMDITKEIASIQLDTPLKIGINGCARCCTPCHTLDISVVGDTSGYRISLGGKTKQVPEFASYFAEGVPAKELPKRLRAVIEAFKNLAEARETLHDVIERCGVADFVKALAPYSQDAAQREGPFTDDAESAASLDLQSDEDSPEELDLESEPELDLEDALSDGDDLALPEQKPKANAKSTTLASDDEIDSSELDEDPVTLHDDAPDQLEEIPINHDEKGSLEDDLSLNDLDGDLELEALSNENLGLEDSEAEVKPAQEEEDLVLDFDSPEDDLASSKQIGEEDDLVLASESDEDLELSVNDDPSSDDDLSLKDDTLALDDESELNLTDGELLDDPVMEDIDAEEDLLLESDSSSEMNEDLEDLSSLETPVDMAEDLSEDSSLDAGSLEDISVEIPEDDLELDDSDLAVSSLSEEGELDALELAPLEEDSDLELEESMSPDEELSEDLENAPLSAQESSVDQDLEGIPELDEDLALEQVPPARPMAAKPSASTMSEDFGEELPEDVPDLSDEEENQFEQKLHASIDEESRMMAKVDKDPNIGDRQAALSLLQQDMEVDEDGELESEAVEEGDEELEPINETMEEFPEPGSRELAQISSRQLGQKMQSGSKDQQFKLSAISFQDDHMRVTFESGAYVDFDMTALGIGEERNFRLGLQNVSVTSTSDGYILGVDGMRIFHPKSSLPAAS